MKKYKQWLLENNQPKYDLTQLFNMINKKAFNNRLDPNRIILRWSKHKQRVGEAKIGGRTYNRDTGLWEITTPVTISISKLFDFDESEIISILAHEMIHADHYIRGLNISDDSGHGKPFPEDAREVGRKLGVKITVTHKNKLKLATKSNFKELGYILIKYADGGWGLILFTPDAFKKFMDGPFERFRPQMGGVEIYHGIKPTTLGGKYKVKRSFRSLGIYDITEEEAQEVL